MSRSRVLELTVAGERRTVELRGYLDPARAERAACEANAWVKALRHAAVDDRTLRDRFTYRGDSLWWFTELFLHRQGVIQDAWDTALALDALAERARPAHVRAAEGDPVLQHLLPQAAARFGFSWTIDKPAEPARERWWTDLRSRVYTWGALASRFHPRRLFTPSGLRRPHLPGRFLPRRLMRRPVTSGGRPRAATNGTGVLVFAHSAFWRPSRQAADEGEEGYIGAVLRELRTRAEVRPLRLVGVGPRTNFRARRWWHPLRPRMLDPHELPLTPIEDFASWPALAGSRRMWRDRMAIERALLSSHALRDRARVLDYDIWPILAGELRGVARLQFPWSARAMDEAAAVLDTVRPRMVVTYAEAGGWGRALMLEARRRNIPSVGLQHGFIYRHWLNYLHADDEMEGSEGNRQDRGFPRPDLTLLYDHHAAQHLQTAGHFPERSVRVTGSPALDALTAAVSHVNDADRARVREQLGAAPDERLVVVVSKYTQIGAALPALVAAAAMEARARVRLVIKPHPAETAEAYAPVLRDAAGAGGAALVTIAPATLDLASLLASARLLVTVNSTVAIDAMTLGVPALVVGLPNNLSPFVEAGAMAGWAATSAEPPDPEVPIQTLRQTLAELTQDDDAHAALVARARAFAAQHGIGADGQAARRAVEAMVELYNG